MRSGKLWLSVLCANLEGTKQVNSIQTLMTSVVLATCMAGSTTSAASVAHTTPPPHDGARDFDWEIGTWKTTLKRRLRPLTGSEEWVEYAGTTTVKEIWGGRANLVELNVAGSTGRILAGSWRLYNPESRQWSLNFANSTSGSMTAPAIGEFREGRGEFYSAETLNGRAILVRFVIFDITRDSAKFEQAFSDDGGKTWETNWIASDIRVR